MPAASSISLPLPFNQLVELVKKLPEKQKQKLMHVLEEDMPDTVPEWQKQEVRKRINKYKKHPGLLVDEKTALKQIKAM
ncbi:MAG: addiction module protein [Chitinophagaceae bacterium]|nr:addiction module protein [Chitinophagaceae bacterium]